MPSGPFLQTLPEFVTLLKGHTPSITFRHFPPNSARTGYAIEGAHSEHRFPALSSRLLPELVTPLKRHTPSIAFRHFPTDSSRIGYATEGAHSEHRFAELSSKLCQNWLRCQQPPKGFGTNNTLSPVLPQ